MPRLRPWGFPTVSPSHPSLFPHHGTRRITVEFSEDSQNLCVHPTNHRPQVHLPVEPGVVLMRPL